MQKNAKNNETPKIIEVFEFDGRSVYVELDENGNPYFLANDVCRILGYSNLRDAISKHCNPKGVVKRDTLTRGGTQKMTFITEGNIYRLVAKSRNPEAAAFEEWVFDEVLPTLRKKKP
jgi:prophage antirepressor-like protein